MRKGCQENQPEERRDMLLEILTETGTTWDFMQNSLVPGRLKKAMKAVEMKERRWVSAAEAALVKPYRPGSDSASLL